MTKYIFGSKEWLEHFEIMETLKRKKKYYTRSLNQLQKV
jgi:hypothetical protein